MIALFQEKIRFGAEIVELASLFFEDEIEYNEEAKQVLQGEQVPEVARAFANKIKELDIFDGEHIQVAIKEIQKETGHKGKKLFMPIRVMSSGQVHGPDLIQLIFLLGRDKVVQRTEQIL